MGKKKYIAPGELLPPASELPPGQEIADATDEINRLPLDTSELESPDAEVSGVPEYAEQCGLTGEEEPETGRREKLKSARVSMMIRSAAAAAISVVVINASLGFNLIDDDILAMPAEEMRQEIDGERIGDDDDDDHGSSESHYHYSNWLELIFSGSGSHYEEGWEEDWDHPDKPWENPDDPWQNPDDPWQNPDDPWEDPDSGIERADFEFPTLTNLEPNGEIVDENGQKFVLNEEFIRLEGSRDSTNQTYIVAGSAYGRVNPFSSDEIFYNSDENTLYLNNFSGEVLNVNMMGNGFRIHLSGENSIDHLLVWGFYYGGSVTFVGDGSLTVNAGLLFETGVLLRAEESESCIMVSPGVTLDIYGAKEAVSVIDSTAEKGIYYLDPVTLNEGKRSPASSDTGEPATFTIVRDSGESSTHVVFQ